MAVNDRDPDAEYSRAQFVATAISVTHETSYGECAGALASLMFVATRPTREVAEAELAGWAKRNVDPSSGTDVLLHITRVNEYGDRVEQFDYATVTTIELIRSDSAQSHPGGLT